MRILFSVIITFCMFAIIVSPVHAIVFLPAIVLIPIAKIVALIIGGFSLPALGIGTLWSKLFGKSLIRTVTVIIIALILLSTILVLFFKIQNPERPLL